MKRTRKPNQLIYETSPYLLKHAYNPVSWYPWCEEAFEKAQMEDKPVFVSIGYYSCHWCNVMEKESFESELIAEFLNKNFISIKIDREELPDIDHQYQLVFQLMNGRGGGWPLTVFMSPDRIPFFTGTYFPPHSKMGMPGFLDLLKQISETYRNQRDKINNSKESIKLNIRMVQERLQGKLVNDLPHISLVQDAALDLASLYDKNDSGFGSAPKFPHESSLTFLLHEGVRQGNKTYIKMVKYSLERMCSGGIYDQLGGGFHRYSVDNEWLVPHFEKMLYNQALMADILIDMYQVSKENFFLIKARETLDYVIRELRSSEGGFYSGADADSEGVEGKYFVWEKEEILNLLGKEHGEIFSTLFGVKNRGNWEGKNILHMVSSIDHSAKKFRKSKEEIEKLVNECKLKLFNHRTKRIPPGIDKKVLSGWSALMVRPLFRLAGILGENFSTESYYSSIAIKTLDFICEKMIVSDELFRVYGKSQNTTKLISEVIKIPGYLEDYVYVVYALLTGFEYTLSEMYFEKSKFLVKKIFENFGDKESGGFFSSNKKHMTPIERYKDIFDSPLPSPNALAAGIFQKLYYFTEDSIYLEHANKLFKSFIGAAEQKSGLGMATYFLNLSLLHFHNTEIIFIEQNQNFPLNLEENLWTFLQKEFILGRIQLKLSNDLSNLPKQFYEKSWIQGKTAKNRDTLYICKDFVCSAPMTKIKDVKKYLSEILKLEEI